MRHRFILSIGYDADGACRWLCGICRYTSSREQKRQDPTSI